MFGSISEIIHTFDMQINFAIPFFFTFVGSWGNSFPFIKAREFPLYYQSISQLIKPKSLLGIPDMT